MFSPQHILVASLYSMLIYKISSEASSPIRPIWSFPSEINTGSVARNFQCSPPSYGMNAAQPTIWVVESSRFSHYLQLSNSEHPVEEHVNLPLEHRGIAMASSRAMSMDLPLCGKTLVSTVTLSNPPTQGGFTLDLMEGVDGKFRGRYAFDEISGRLIWGVEEASGKFCMYLCSLS